MSARRGLTLVELVLALGLASLLLLALLTLLDTSLSLFSRTEDERELMELGAGIGALLEEDLAALDGGAQGDLVAEWLPFDTDGDGVAAAALPRLRLVRLLPESAAAARALRAAPAGASSGPPVVGEQRVEVLWALLPTAGVELDADARGARGARTLWRAEQPRGAEVSFLDRAYDGGGSARSLDLLHVADGVLWLEVTFAGQTSLLANGWRVGDGLGDCAGSWDAWGRGRPDASFHVWNERGAGVPDADELPVLPRRARIVVELERAVDLRRRTRLGEALTNQEPGLVPVDPDRLPEAGGFVLVDEEWMEVRGVQGGVASVARGARGTRPAAHEAGALVHWGAPVVIEVPVPLHREDWNL